MRALASSSSTFFRSLCCLAVVATTTAAAAQEQPGAAPPPPPGYAPPPAYASYGAPPAYGPPPAGYYAPSEDAQERAAERAEAAKPSKNIALATNMLNLVVQDFGLEVGIRLADFVSVNLNASYWGFKDLTLYGVGAGFQFFPTSGKTFKGFYIYPSIIYLKATSTETTTTNGTSKTTTSSGSAIGIGATFGYQWLLKSGLLFRVGGGLVHYSVSDDTSDSLRGVVPNIDGHIGFAF